jgi:hypothetical protein
MKGYMAMKMYDRGLLEKGISTKQEFLEKVSVGSQEMKRERK